MRYLAMMLAAATLVPSGAGAAGTPAILAAPGSRAANYATPVVFAEPGDEIRFVNLEPFVHDVRSVVSGPDDTPWCNAWGPGPEDPVTNPRQFPLGQCPLIWTPQISMTIGAVESVVHGTENLTKGTTIEFVCTVFGQMRGTMHVV